MVYITNEKWAINSNLDWFYAVHTCNVHEANMLYLHWTAKHKVNERQSYIFVGKYVLHAYHHLNKDIIYCYTFFY